jgi:hypothetical protein
MPVHDWTRVADGTFHHFHVTWIPLISSTLNHEVLPEGYYAMAEQVAGFVPDVLTLQAANDDLDIEEDESGGVAVAVSPPKVSVTAKLEQSIYVAKSNRLVIRHRSRDRMVAIIEVLSAGNKSSGAEFKRLLDKTTSLLWEGIHVLLIDLYPPTRRDPQGIHGAIWQELGGENYIAPPDKPLTLAAYSAYSQETAIEAYVQPIAVGDILPPMPLFLAPDRYVDVPLEESYQNAVTEIPQRARRPLDD